VIILGIFVATVVKLQHFVISEPDEVHHRSRVAIQQLSAPVAANHVCTHGTLTSALQHSQQRIFNQPPYIVKIF